MTLSPRQQQILEMAADGLFMGQMATRLGISVRTVEVHRKIVQVQLGACNMAHAVAIAFRNGILK